MIEQTLMEFARTSPDFAVGVEEIKKRLSNTPIVAEDLMEAIQMLEIALQDPTTTPHPPHAPTSAPGRAVPVLPIGEVLHASWFALPHTFQSSQNPLPLPSTHAPASATPLC